MSAPGSKMPKKAGTKPSKNAKKKKGSGQQAAVVKKSVSADRKKVEKRVVNAIERANPDLSESWKGREMDTVAPNRVIRSVGSDWDIATSFAATAKWMAVFSAVIAKIDAVLPGTFVSTGTVGTGNVAYWSPSDIMAYFHFVCCQYLYSVGALTTYAGNANYAGDVSGHDLNVPLPIALLLQYFAPYRKHGLDYSCAFYNTLVTTAAANGAVQTNATAGTQGLGIVPTIGINNAAVVPATVGESVGAVGLQSVNATNIRQYANAISSILGTLCTCVPLGEIPKTAPDASAYGLVVIDSNGVAQRIMSATPYLDAEMAYFLADTTTNANYFGSFDLPVPGFTFNEATTINATYLPSTAATVDLKRNWLAMSFVEVTWKVPKLLGVPIKSVIAKSDYGRLTSIVVIPKTISLNLWHAYATTLAIRSGSTNHDQICNLVMYLDCVLVAKLGEFNLWGRTANAAFYYYDKAYLGASLPLHAKHALESLGPVIRSGRLQIPQMLYTGGDFLASYMSTSLRSNTATAYPFQGFCNESSAAAMTLAPNAQVITVAGGYNSGALYAITPNVFTPIFTDNYMNLVNSWGSGSTTNITAGILALFPLDANTLLGDITNHSWVVVGQAGATVSGEAVIGNIAPKDISVDMAGLNVEMSRIDLARTLVTAWFPALYITGNPDGFRATAYVARYAGGVRPASSMVLGDTSTFAREASTSAAVGRKALVKSIAGHTVDVAPTNGLALALAPVIAMTAASLIPPAVNFIESKIRPKGKPFMQYAAFGAAPEKIADRITQSQQKFNEMKHYYNAFRGDPKAGVLNTLNSLAAQKAPMYLPQNLLK